MSRFAETMGGSPVISCEGREVLQRTRVRQVFNGSSFDAHDGPVRCCRAVQLSNDCQTVAAHEASGGKSTERVQLQLHARVWTKTQLHWHARVWTKTQGRGRKLVSIQKVALALPAADCVDRIEQRMQAVGWLCGTHCWTCLGLDCHEFRMLLQLHTICAIHTAITFPPLVSCAATLTVVAQRHNAAAPHWAVMGIK
jgi:hypothetical protein